MICGRLGAGAGKRFCVRQLGACSLRERQCSPAGQLAASLHPCTVAALVLNAQPACFGNFGRSTEAHCFTSTGMARLGPGLTRLRMSNGKTACMWGWAGQEGQLIRRPCALERSSSL
jgi:hypothetical protein